MDECAYGVSTTTGIFGATQNPWRVGYSAGGSSGGPAAAVAARLCYGALGTDTGGSIRQPAAWCGVVGLKPTYGLVSARGVIPLSWSLDHVGPIGRSATDAAILLQAIAGYDSEDPASVDMPAVDYAVALGAGVAELRLGKPANDYFAQLDPEVAAAINAALDLLTEITTGVTTIELPPASALTVMFVEAAGYYGPLLRKFPDGFSPAVRTMLKIGGNASGAVYALDLRRLRRLRQNIHSVFTNTDLLITPTTPDLPMTIAEARQPAIKAGPPLAARNTMPFNLYGLPAVSIPCGFSRSGLPIGLQISGPPGGEARVLALAAAWERHTNWHRRPPPEQG
jgi:aspartyl-tRNA(Asn)/glutamyl-tRNA(Gln) amidotransferase subunit A